MPPFFKIYVIFLHQLPLTTMVSTVPCHPHPSAHRQNILQIRDLCGRIMLVSLFQLLTTCCFGYKNCCYHGKNSNTLTVERKCCLVILSPKFIEMHSKFKVKNVQHFDKLSFISGNKKIHLYYILMINNQQALGSKKGKQFRILRSKLIHVFDIPNTDIFTIQCKDCPGETL